MKLSFLGNGYNLHHLPDLIGLYEAKMTAFMLQATEKDPALDKGKALLGLGFPSLSGLYAPVFASFQISNTCLEVYHPHKVL